MAIGPEDVSVIRCARSIEERRLRDEHKRSLGVLVVSDSIFCLGDLFERPTEMHGDGGTACRCPPGDGLGECAIPSEGTRAILKPLRAGPGCRQAGLSARGAEWARRYSA